MKTKRILVIDENINEYQEFTYALKSEFIVDEVGYIETARFKLQRNHYDLIVLDIMMPTLGLFDFNKASGGLRTGFVYYEEELKEKNIPVLFWSWNSDFEKEIKDFRENKSGWESTDFQLKESDYYHLLNGVKDFFEKLYKNYQ